MACVNKNLPEFKALAAELGNSLAESIVVANKYEIPTVEQAVQIIRGSNVLQYKKAVRYLETTTSSNVDDLVNNLNRVIQKYNNDYFVIKGSPLNQNPAPLADVEIQAKNIAFLQELNNQFGQIFVVTPSASERAPKPGRRLFNEPNPETAVIAEQYKAANNITVPNGENIYKLDVSFSKRIADAFEEMVHNPNDPTVKASYEAMAQETLKQFEAIQKAGYTIELFQGAGEPYTNSQEMINDVRNNKHLFVLSTEKDFGQNPISDQQREENPLLRDSGFKDVNGVPLLINDVFRYVHDFFGHTERGNSFGPVGEENAWDVHARMYTPLARRAMTTETRGQNSWVNFGPHMRNEQGGIIAPGEPGYLSATQRPFAEQKIGLLPEVYSDIRLTSAEYGNDEFSKKLQDFARKVADKENRSFPNVIQFVEAILPKQYVAKYRALYELASKLELSVNVSDNDVPYQALASFGDGSINISPRNSMVYIESWEQFVETLNREVIHGIMSRNWGNDFDLHSKLQPIFEKIKENYDSAPDHIKTLIDYIDEASEEFTVSDFRNISEENEQAPEIPALEELITYAFTDQEFAQFLDNIPATGTVTDSNKGNSIWQQLKNLIKDFFASFTPKSVLDEIASALDEYFTVDGSIEDYQEKRIKYGWIRPIKISDEIQNKTVISSNTHRVSINEQALQDLVDRNKQNPKQEYFQKVQENSTEFDRNIGFWSEDQKRAFSLANTTRMLQSKFGIQFHFVNDPNATYRGKFSQGKIIINEARVYPDTPFHEIVHPFILVMKNQNPELYNSLKEDLQSSEQGQRILKDVQDNYSELSADEQIDEAIAEYVGRVAGERNLQEKPWYQRFLDWLRTTLANMGVFVKDFQPTMSLSQFADLILDPAFVFDFERSGDLQNLGEFYQKSTVEVETAFNNTMNDVLRKLQADVNIPAKNDQERTRKYFSSQQLKALQQNRKDIKQLDSFVLSALSQTKKVTEAFEEFRVVYENKNQKTPEDIRKMTDLLYQMENTIVLYNDLRPLLRSMRELFPDEEDNWGSLVKYLERQDELIEGYKKYGLDAVSEWLMPYMKKAINQAKASGNIHSIVSVDTYTQVSNTLKSQGVTDEDVILRQAVKQEIQNTLKVAKDDTGFFSNWFSGVLNEKDAIAQLVGLALSDEIQKALKKASKVRDNILKALKQYRGNVTFANAKSEEEFYKKYLRQARSYEYVGLDQNGNEKYDYVNRWAFHEEYLWDEFYNAKREFMEKLGERPSRNSPQFAAWQAKREAWFNVNTKAVVNVNGRLIYTPADKYRNNQFDAMMNDPYYKVLYQSYKEANDKLGNMGLRYGMIPQVSKGKNLFSNVLKSKKFKEGLKKTLSNVREGIGAEEQIYYAENIEGFERKTVPINYVRLLEEEDLSFNLADGVSKLVTTSAKYEAMKSVEPHVLTLKNFINGNAYLKIDKRQALKNSAKGFAKLKKGSKDVIPVEAKRLNDMLNGFIDDVVYGESDERQIVQFWGARFIVYDKTDTSNNGKPVKQIIKNFEDLRQRVGKPDLNFSDFKENQPQEFGNTVVTLANKDWNLSLNKMGNFAGIVTAVQTMAFNINSLVMNVGIGNVQSFVEASGGKYFNLKDWAGAQKEYWTSMLTGNFFEDVRGGKQSEISQLISHYDAIQGEFEDTLGRKITPGIANKLFRRDNLFLVQRAGEHQIQATGMLAAMRGQKLKTKSGETINLRQAWVKDQDNNLKLRDDIIWSEEDDRQFREKLSSINKELNGNYSKLDKAKAQRIWWTRALLMFRKHVYNAFKARYGKSQVNYERGTVTEGYYRTFGRGLVEQLSEYILNRKFRTLNDQERYAMRKVAADLGIIVAMFALFKGTDDDDDENEFNDEVAFWARRMLSDTAQYAPVVGWLELWKMVKDPSASANTVTKYYEAISQFIVDPDERYERSGPGYTKGELKWKVKMAKIIPIYRQWVNIQNPEGLLDYYKLNVKSVFNSKKQTEEEQQELQQELEQEFGNN